MYAQDQRRSRKSAAILAATATCAGLLVAASPAGATPFVVTGLSNVYGAGHATAPAPGGGGEGTLPFEFAFSAGAGQSLRMNSVAGLVDCVVRAPTIGADGAPCVSADTNVNPFGGISGIVSTGRQMYLVGVFTDGTEPTDPAPSSIVYGVGDYSSANYAPLLGQVFFIGDGLTGTGSGATQEFLVPTTASKLYLGFADAFDFGGSAGGSGLPPGWYGDNVGTLAGDFTIGAASVPEPGTLAGLVLGLGILGFSRRRLAR